MGKQAPKPWTVFALVKGKTVPDGLGRALAWPSVAWAGPCSLCAFSFRAGLDDMQAGIHVSVWTAGFSFRRR